ncbi:MAG TPA: helix-turn-helix transcriptional regulator [Dehalococcoidia bacterium]|nr:helix-turn-helix transcriptional regulator [Dehalococcoidia bacterium]
MTTPGFAPMPDAPARPTWTFLTNHPVILVFVVQHPESTVRVISQGVGLTERATLAILRDLDNEGLVERHRSGRRNTYVVNYGRLLGLSTGTALSPPAYAVVGALISISPEARATARDHEPTEEDKRPRETGFEFFTNHTMMLAAIARANTATVRELAGRVRVTERAAMAIVSQLEAEGIVQRRREGRRNTYTIDLEAFRHFRGWTYDGWAMPKPLVDVAVAAVRALGRL